MKIIPPLAALSAAILLLAPTTAGAQTAETRDVRAPSAESVFARALTDVERAFYRKQSYVDPSTGLRELAPASLAALAGYGFLPSNPAYSLSLTAIDSTHSRVCLQMEVTSEALWRAATRLLVTPGVTRADAQCNPISASAVPAKWPVTLYAVKVLDSEDAMARTLVPAAPLVSGIDTSVVALPAMTLPALPGEWSQPVTVIISNPALPAPQGQPAAPALNLVKASVREGFHVEHNCVQVAAQQSCAVAVRYLGNAAHPFRVGTLRLEFSDGNFATVGILGKRGKGTPKLTGTPVSVVLAPITGGGATLPVTGPTTPSTTEPAGSTAPGPTTPTSGSTTEPTTPTTAPTGGTTPTPTPTTPPAGTATPPNLPDTSTCVTTGSGKKCSNGAGVGRIKRGG